MFERPKNGESAILVSLNIDDIDHKENTREFKLLASSAGFKVAEIFSSITLFKKLSCKCILIFSLKNFKGSR